MNIMKMSDAKASLVSVLDYNDSLADNHQDADKLVPYIVGQAGLGKTSIVQQACKETKRGLVMLSLAQLDPTELGGIRIPSEDRKSVNVTKPDWFVEVEKQNSSSELNGGVVFCDELAQAPISVLNTARQLINEGRVGQWHLPKGWHVLTAGNRLSDKAGVNRLPSHMKDCLTYFNVEGDVEDTCNYFVDIGVDFKVIAYLRANQDFYCKNDPSQDSNPTPRSWQRVGNMLKMKGMDARRLTQMISGQVGESACASFVGFLKIIADVPEFLDLDKLVNNPEKASLPDRPDVMYALCSALSFKANNKNIGNIIKYVERLKAREMGVVLIKDAIRRDKTLRSNADVKNWVRNSGRELVL